MILSELKFEDNDKNRNIGILFTYLEALARISDNPPEGVPMGARVP
jgi:hypothetical protein